MKKKRSIIIGFILLQSYFLHGVPNYKALETPVKFIVPKDGVNIGIDNGQKTVSGSTWFVYLINSDAGVYQSAAASKSISKINVAMYSEFIVVDETQDKIHLVTDPGYNMAQRQFSPQVKDYYWFSKRDFLLWKHCLVTQKGAINKKAMILNTIKKGTTISSSSFSEKIDFYTNPGLTVRRNEKSPQLFQVYYVFAVTTNAVLLGTQFRISNTEYINDDLLGWVSINRITSWDSRVAIEPTWELEQAELRKQYSIKASAFETSEAAVNYMQNSQSSVSAIWNADPYDERFIGEWRRFPVLDKPTAKGIAPIGIMGAIMSSGGQTANEEKYAELRRKFNGLSESLRNINIVFVIDGTNSMGPYFNSVANAIQKSMLQITSQYGSKVSIRNRLKFGAVVYRDAGSIKPFELIKLTDEYPKLTAFLNNIDTRDPGNNTISESVNYGLQMAIRNVGWDANSANESNFIILIGDAGNHKLNNSYQVSANKVEDGLIELNANFLAFQVNNGNNSTYDDFIKDNSNLIINCANRKYGEFKSTYMLDLYGTSPSFVKVGNSITTKNSVKMGMLVAPAKGKKLAPIEIENRIGELITIANANNEKFLSAFEKIVEGGIGVESMATEIDNNSNNNSNVSIYVSNFSPAIAEVLKSMNLSKNDIDLLKKDRAQFYIEGFAPLVTKHNKEDVRLFSNVLFMNKLDLSELINKFNKLTTGTSGSTQRKNMQDAWKELYLRYVGESTNEAIENLSIEEITQSVFDLPGKSSLMKKVKLGSITDERQIDNVTFQKYVNEIQQKKRMLETIFNSPNYDYSFRSNNELYYWISEDFLP